MLGYANWESFCGDLNTETMYGPDGVACILFACWIDSFHKQYQVIYSQLVFTTQWLVLGQVVQQNPGKQVILNCIWIKAEEIRARHGNIRNGWPDDDVKDWSARILFFPSVQLKKTFKLIEMLCDTMESSRGAFVVH